MNKIKTAIIHWLGGYTDYENYAQYRRGQKEMLANARGFFKTLYGQPSDEQLKRMWNFINEE